MDLEQKYKNIDFAQFSKVKESLREKLHKVRKGNADFAVITPVTSLKRELSMDELDYAVAAKGNEFKKPEDEN